MKKMTIWGVGPRIMFPGYSILFVLSGIPIKISIQKITGIPGLYITGLSSILIIVGILFLAIGNFQIKEAMKTKKLVTTGLFSYIRNPMYISHLFFIMPGICLLTNNAITFCSVISTLIIFYALISKEEKDLEEYFGSEYKQYRNNVGRLLPKVAFRKGH
jgi:protein-S-isoprenylcysteine O-methyltransferase Ste14